MTRPLRIRLLLDPARARVWHRRLAQSLSAQGHAVEFALASAGPAIPIAVSLLLTLERLVYGQADESPGAAWAIAPQSVTSSETPADLVLDITGRAQATTARTLRPIYAGALLEEAAIAALLDGRVPEIGIQDSAQSSPRVFTAAVERPRVLCKALDNLGARLETIFVSAVADIALGRPTRGRPSALAAPPHLGLAAALTHRARAALTSLASKPPHWFVGWRKAAEDRISETKRLPRQGWTRLPDDGARFYADPFVFAHAGRIWLFLEEFQYATGKAVISVVEMGQQGPMSTARPIIERPYHLSYPFIFERDGAIWMLPEMSSARRLELLRAVNFPYEWETAELLFDGAEVSDATIVEHEARLWLFGAVGGASASSWDALHLWSAPRLAGPWQPHAKNPVLIDAAGARPAGAMYRRGPELWRPAQDCTRGYGAGLSLARVTRLDDEAFEQEVAARLYPDSAWPGIGLHTLNWAAGIEVVDGATAGRS